MLIFLYTIYKKMCYYISKDVKEENSILGKRAKGIFIYRESDEKTYYINNPSKLKEVFENKDILKIGYKQKTDYILLKKL